MMYMLDTNICIYAIKNKPEQVLCKVKDHRKDGLCISAVTLSELEYGAMKSAAPEKNQVSILQLLLTLDVLPFNEKAAIEYGKIRAYLEKCGTPIGPLDTLIAAHAKSTGLVLVTNNTREFIRVPDLKVENWAV